MKARLDQIRRFAQPVSDEAVPALTQRVCDAARLVVLVAVGMGLWVRTVDVVTGYVGLGPVARFQALLFCGYAPLGVLAHRKWGRRHPSVVTFITGAMAITEIAGSWMIYGPDNPIFPYISIIPMVFAVMAPVRPAAMFGIGAVGTIATLTVGSMYMGLPQGELGVRTGLCVAFAVVSAIASQRQRRMWLEMEKADARSRLVAADRLTHMGRLSAALAHELKTPLATALNQLGSAHSLVDEMAESIGHADVSEDDLREINGEIAEALSQARDAADRSAKVVRTMRDSTRAAAPGSSSRFSIRSRAELIAVLLKRRLQVSGHRVELGELADEVHGNPVQFDQVLTNLVRNALDAMEHAATGTTVWIDAEPRNGGTLITVEDDGPGVAEDVAERLFEHGFSTKLDKDGLGIGLWLSRNLARSRLGGELELAAAGSGTHGGGRFEWWLPAPGVAAARVNTASAKTMVWERTEPGLTGLFAVAAD